MLFAYKVRAVLGAFGHALDVAPDDELRDLGCEESLAGAQRVNSGNQVAHGVAFQHIAEGAGVEHLLNHLRRVMHGKNQDLGAAATFHDLARRVKSIESRHADIQQGNVGIEQANFLDRVLAIPGFSDDGPAKLRLEKIAQTEPYNFVVVCQEQP